MSERSVADLGDALGNLHVQGDEDGCMSERSVADLGDALGNLHVQGDEDDFQLPAKKKKNNRRSNGKKQLAGSPEELPPPHIIEPMHGRHNATLVILHGFCCDGSNYCDDIMPVLQSQLTAEQLFGLRLVFLNAPSRLISCYGTPKSEEKAWHDYLTDHGGSEGRPEIEEEIDVEHVEWCRRQVHKALDVEVDRFGGDCSRVALLGQSQGSCIALDAALTYRKRIAGVFCAIGQLYSCTPIPANRKALDIATFNGAGDRCIGASLVLRSYAKRK